jgi:hypothetical protein
MLKNNQLFLKRTHLIMKYKSKQIFVKKTENLCNQKLQEKKIKDKICNLN